MAHDSASSGSRTSTPTSSRVASLPTRSDLKSTILAKRGGEPRRRFTIAHQLGHFLMAQHVPDQPGRFLCKSSDLLRVTAKEGDQRQRREVEANRFATLLLMPPHLLRGAMAAFREPDLEHVLVLARDFAVGKEAAGRAYVQYHPERIAIVVAGNGRVQRCYRSPLLSRHHLRGRQPSPDRLALSQQPTSAEHRERHRRVQSRSLDRCEARPPRAGPL
ncbi:ImmA/IrrE family metallo-endopeptidase (plasmid) [Methylobacterium oryzae CBMB20]